MKENEWCVYVREYSELPGLQQAGAIRYSLMPEGSGLCLRAEQSRDSQPDRIKTASCRLSGITRSAAERLLRYLYENGVEPASLNAVVGDCLAEQLMGQPSGGDTARAAEE